MQLQVLIVINCCTCKEVVVVVTGSQSCMHQYLQYVQQEILVTNKDKKQIQISVTGSQNCSQLKVVTLKVQIAAFPSSFNNSSY